MFKIGTVCDRGLSPKRPINEDRYLAMPEKGLFAVADGVGGGLAGEVASQTVIDTLAETMSNYNFDAEPEEFIDGALRQANKRIYELSLSRQEYAGMASTVALIFITDGKAIIAHVGDSRVYSFGGLVLSRETFDHTDLGDAIRLGQISKLESNRHSENVINRAVGFEPQVEPEFSLIGIKKNDAILLCTDGITRHITDDELREVLTSDLTPQQMCDELKRRCYCRGAEDNLTAVILKMAAAIEEDEERTLQPLKPKLGFKQNEPGDRTSRIQVEVDAAVTERTAAKSSDHRGQAVSSEPLGGSLFSSALKLPLLTLALAGAFYAGIYAAQKYLPPNRVSPVAEPTEKRLAASSYLRKGAQADAAFQTALELFDSLEYAAARNRLQQLAERAPTNARYHYWLARAHFETGNYRLALEGFQKAVSLDLGAPTVYLHEALCYQALGQEKEAMQSFKRFAEERKKTGNFYNDK